MIPLILLQTSASTTAPTDFLSTGQNLMPLIIIAMLIDVMIVAIWYFIGVLIRNHTVVEGAKTEFYQFFGTAFLIVIIVWGMTSYSSIMNTVLGSTKLMSQSAMSSMCTAVSGSTKLSLIGNTGAGSFLTGFTTTSGKKASGLCTLLSGTALTDKINYPLVSTGVIIANLTNQSVSNLNASSTFDAFIGFLSDFAPRTTICLALPYTLCMFPIVTSGGTAQAGPPSAATVGSTLEVTPPTYMLITFSYKPYGGYSMPYGNLSALGTLLTFSTESFIAQLLVITILIFAWPYLLFGGLILRSTFFTRRIGGLLIAIALGVVIVFPTMYAIEYLTLANGLPTLPVPSSSGAALTPNVIYGFNSITNIPQGTSNAPSNYIVNFFVAPNMQQLITRNGCWPPGSLFGAELTDTVSTLVPGLNLVSAAIQLGSQVVAGTPYYPVPESCTPNDLQNTVMEMLNSYGIIGVASYFIPIINVMITLTAIAGMSGLMGGDVTLAGLGKFV